MPHGLAAPSKRLMQPPDPVRHAILQAVLDTGADWLCLQQGVDGVAGLADPVTGSTGVSVRRQGEGCLDP